MTQAGNIDPFAAWRDWMAQSERQWNAFLNQSMASDEFSRGMGQLMDAFLNTQKSLNEGIGRMLASMNLPSRSDVLSVGERVAALEDRIVLLAEKVDALSRAIAATDDSTPAKAAARKRPTRTKKPPTE